MNAIDKAQVAHQMLAGVGIDAKIVEYTNGGAAVKFTASNGKPADFSWKKDGSFEQSSKYTYLLPKDLDRKIEAL